MAAPTRAEISATVTTPKYRISIWNSGAWSIIADNDVLGVDSQIESSNTVNGISFGDSVTVSATVRLVATVSFPTVWQYQKIRIEYSFASADWINAFNGFMIAKRNKPNELEITCGGIDRIIDRTKLYTTVYYRRPVATKTTALSVENPASPSYYGGLINEVFWQCGGRPYEQSGTYPTADFYYSCDHALVNPEWSWFAGENLLDELYTLARAGGGQIYQGADNTIRYIQPLNIAGSSSGFVMTDAYYSAIEISQQTAEQVGTVRAAYTPRYLQGNQVIYDDSTARLVLGSAVQTIEGETQLPIYRWTQQSGITTLIKATDYNNDPIVISNYTLNNSAQKFLLTFNNPNTTPIAVNAITITGLPVAAGEKGFVSYGSGTPERSLEDNPYIQTPYHAEKLTRMAYDFYSPLQPLVTLTDCGYDPDRFIGEIVTLASAVLPAASGLFRIVGLSYTLPGITMQARLVSVSGLPQRSQMFISGTAYSAGDTRKVSY